MQYDSTTTGNDSETFCAMERSIPDSTDVDTSVDFLITKEGNRDGYTDKQYERAKQAWKLYLNTGGGGIDNFKHYMRQNLVQNCPITNDDINRAQKIFMHDVGNSKGRTTCRTPTPIREDKIDIPRELIHQADEFDLYIDLFYVNGLPMLTSIDSPIRKLLSSMS